MRLTVAAVLIICAVVSGRVQGQTSTATGAFTNADVVRLLSLGVSDQTVVSVIQEVTQRQFDTGAESIAALKASGASDAVLAAIRRTPAAVVVGDDAAIERQKFTALYEAGQTLGRAVASTDATLGQIAHLLQSFKMELTAARDQATTQAERVLVTKYTLAQAQFDAGSNQMNVPLRLDAWVKATAALEDAETFYRNK